MKQFYLHTDLFKVWLKEFNSGIRLSPEVWTLGTVLYHNVILVRRTEDEIIKLLNKDER